MIQRIQTVYLLLTTIIAILFLSGDIILFENGASLTISGINRTDTGIIEPDWLLTALLLAVPLLSFIVIFLYKSRKFQMKLTLLLILLVILASAYLLHLAFRISESSATHIVFTYKLVLPLLMVVFTILAYFGIRKDEDIVRSYDRLR